MRIVVGFLMVLVGSILPLGVTAQDNFTYPTYFQVTGVAANDVLNMRSEGSADAPVVGSLAYNASPVEVHFISSGWAYVSGPEMPGFVSMRFLEPIEVDIVANTDLPQGLACGGTEPFWNVIIDNDTMKFDALDMQEVHYPITAANAFYNLGGSSHFILADDGKRGLTAVISNQMCSDGMSDQDYPRAISLILPTEQGMLGLSGCCHLPPN